MALVTKYFESWVFLVDVPINLVVDDPGRVLQD